MSHRIWTKALLPLLALLLLSVTAFALDSDADGLSDSFENAIGTNPNAASSDADGWSDFDELYVYGTDPNMEDTDGDGYWDDDPLDTNPNDDGATYDGVSTPSFSGAESGTPYAGSGETPTDGVGVMVHDGRFIYSTTDGHTKGVAGLHASLTLLYSSVSDWDGLTGKNWYSILDSHASEDLGTGDITWRMLDGVERTFTYNAGPPGYYDPVDDPRWIPSIDSGMIKITLPGNYLTLTYDPTGNAAGRLTKLEDRFGNSQTWTYNVGGQATSTTDSRGESHTITYYSGTGRLKSYQAADGRTWTYRYNAAAQLMRIEGPSSTTFAGGIWKEFRYMQGISAPLNNNMTVALDGEGQSWLKMQYDTSDRVTEQTVGSGDYEFDYSDASNNKTTVTDRVGNDRIWTWDATKLTRTKLQQKSNRNVRSGDPTEWVTEWAHDSDGYLTSVTLPEGNGTKYTLNANKRVTERRHKTDMAVADSASNDLIHEWEYDATHSMFVTKYTDPEDNETDYTLNSDGQPTQVTFETLTNVSPTVTIDHDYTYNANGTLATFVDGESKTTKTVYYTTGAKKGRVKERIVDFGGLALKTEFDYEDWGDVKKVTDPEGNITQFEVEKYGNVTKITYPAALGYITEFEHDANLNVTTKKFKNIDETGTVLTSPSWWETDYGYDVMDNVTSVLEDVSTIYQRNTEIQYDANENRTLHSVGSGSTAHMNEWTYDERDLVYERTRAGGGAGGSSESFEYDDNGNLDKHTNNRGKITTHAYDGFDRRTSTTNALSDYAEYVYDKNSNLTERKFSDELGATDDLMAHHKRHYDEMNRFYKEEDLLEGTTNVWHDRVYELDKRGLVTKLTNRRGEDTTYTFDGARRRTNRIDALGNEIDWTYDDNGNVTKVEETEVIPGSMSTEVYETQFTFDAINRRLTQKVIDRNLGTNFKLTTWKYNSRNVVAERLDPKNNKVTFEHDGLGRVTKKTEDMGSSAAIVTQWELDDWNNVTKLTDDNGKDTTYAYDLMLGVTKTWPVQRA